MKIACQKKVLKLNEKWNKEIKEAGYLSVVLLILLIGLKIAFYKESTLVLIRSAVSLFWIFILPGFTIMHYWESKLDFLERLIIGAALSAAATGILSYYLGLIGINLKYHPAIIPSALILIGIYLFFVSKSSNTHSR